MSVIINGDTGIDKITDGSIVAADIGSGEVTQAKLASGFPLGKRNLIINGDMRIAQRGTSASGASSGNTYKTIDRFSFGLSSAGTWTMSQDTDVPSGKGFANSLKLDCTTANGSLSAGSTLFINHKMEGQNLQHLKYGTSNAEKLTLSFWVKSNKTGTYILELDQDGNAKNYCQSYSITSADTWEKKTITYDGDTVSSLANDNTNELEVHFWLGAGTDYTSGTLATSWESTTNANRAVGQVNLADSTSNYINITGVQLEVGDAASDFEFVPYDMELARCHRYYWQKTEAVQGSKYSSFAGAQTSTVINSMLILPVTMRTDPTLTASAYSQVGLGASPTSISGSVYSDTVVRIGFTVSGAVANNVGILNFDILANAEL